MTTKLSQKIKLFPSSSFTFTLAGDQEASMERLLRRTDLSESLSSAYTDKSFRGQIKGNTFMLITSEIGKGAFCSMTGELNDKTGKVYVEINKPFRILISVGTAVSVLLNFLPVFIDRSASNLNIIPPIFIMPIFIRIMIEIAFQRFSTRSINRLFDVLDTANFQKQ